jgi:hypothetical protein
MSDEIVWRAEGQLEARLRDRGELVKWGAELARRRDRAALVSTYDASAKAALLEIMDALRSRRAILRISMRRLRRGASVSRKRKRVCASVRQRVVLGCSRARGGMLST